MDQTFQNLARALYDFSFALLGDQAEAEALAVRSLCATPADHASGRDRLLCSLKRLWHEVVERELLDFRSRRPEDEVWRRLDLRERALVAARFVLHLARPERSALFGMSQVDEEQLTARACRKMAEIKKGKNG